jgi:hypothetical protein
MTLLPRRNQLLEEALEASRGPAPNDPIEQRLAEVSIQSEQGETLEPLVMAIGEREDRLGRAAVHLFDAMFLMGCLALLLSVLTQVWAAAQSPAAWRVIASAAGLLSLALSALAGALAYRTRRARRISLFQREVVTRFLQLTQERRQYQNAL